MYGLLAIDAGHYRNAVLLLLRRAVKRAPDFRAAWIELSRAQTEMHELDDAAASARRAIELDPERAGGHIALANALARSSRADEAVASLPAGERNPTRQSGALSRPGQYPEDCRAAALRRLPRTAKACACEPDYAELYWSLSNLEDVVRFVPEEVCTMERALDSEGLREQRDRAFLLRARKGARGRRRLRGRVPSISSAAIRCGAPRSITTP